MKMRLLLVFCFSILLLPVFGAATPEKMPPLTIYYNAEEEPTEKNALAQVLQAQLGKIGVEVKLDPCTSTVWNERFNKGDYEASISVWWSDYPDAEGFLTDFYSKGSYRMAKYDNAEFDKIYLESLKASNEAEKLKLYKQAVAHLDYELPWVPIYTKKEAFLMRPEAAGFKNNAYCYYNYCYVDLPEIRTQCNVGLGQSLDPLFNYDLVSKTFASQCYESLVTMDEKSRVIPSLATEWKWSPKMDQLTFKLRSGVKFQKSPLFPAAGGREVTAKDFKATFERLAKSSAPYMYLFDHVKGVDEFRSGKAKEITGIRAVDDKTLALDLKYSVPLMVNWLAPYAPCVLPADLPANYDFSKHSIGTGPFMLTSWNGVTAQFEANPDYWGKDSKGRQLPYAKKLSIRTNMDPNTTLLAFRKGELDIINIPLALYNNVFNADGSVKEEWKKYSYREEDSIILGFVLFNTQKGPWGKDRALRKKVFDAIDRDAIVKQIFRGKAVPATSIMPKGVPGF